MWNRNAPWSFVITGWLYDWWLTSPAWSWSWGLNGFSLDWLGSFMVRLRSLQACVMGHTGVRAQALCLPTVVPVWHPHSIIFNTGTYCHLLYPDTVKNGSIVAQKVQIMKKYSANLDWGTLWKVIDLCFSTMLRTFRNCLGLGAHCHMRSLIRFKTWQLRGFSIFLILSVFILGKYILKN